MIIEPPLMFGAEEKYIICKQCGKEIDIPATITVKEFDKLPSYIDGFKKGLEDKYFEMKFFGCDKCGWFLKAPRFDRCVYGDKPSRKIKKILDSDISVMEKRCLINYIVSQDIDSLLELYWYCDLNVKDEEKIAKYRLEAIDKLKKEMKTKFSFNSYKLLYADLLRRDKQFDNALDFLHKNINSKILENDEMYNKELRLCEEHNSERH